MLWYVGCLLLVMVNDYGFCVYNGDIGVVLVGFIGLWVVIFGVFGLFDVVIGCFGDVEIMYVMIIYKS